ncbi:MAG: hypothetical protein E7502_04650 [Ruminococcus sp.]|nr:hypothetical protein [Ruminococcus sp.]
MKNHITALLAAGILLLQSVPLSASAGLIEVAPGNMVFLDVQYPDGSSAEGVRVTLHNAAGTEIGGIVNDENFFVRNNSGIDGTELGDDRYCYDVPWSTFTPYVAPQTLHAIKTCRADWETGSYQITQNEPFFINGGIPYKIQLYSYDASQATALTVPANQFSIYVDPKWAKRKAVGHVTTPTFTYYFNRKNSPSLLESLSNIPIGEVSMFSAFHTDYDAYIGLEYGDCGGSVSSNSIEISNAATQYVLCRLPLQQLSSQFRQDGKYERDGLLYDLQQDTQYTSAMLTIQSGAVINVVIPDANGYVEFYVDKTTREYTLDFCYNYRDVPTGNGHSYGGSGFSDSGIAANLTEHFLEALQPPLDEIVLTQVPAGTYTLTYEDIPKGYAAPKTTTLTVTNSQKVQYLQLMLEEAPLLGDVNSDRLINATDAALLLKAASAIGSGNPSGLNTEQTTAADLDKNGTFNAVDAALILQYAAYIGSGGKWEIDYFLQQTLK